MQIRVLTFFLLCFTPIQALESSTSSPALPSQTATITTLPPAQASSNDTNPCDFSDRSALLDRVVSDWQGYNISLLVEKCPNICVLIYGDGNPDVSGIGVSRISYMSTIRITDGLEVLISYIVQFVSTLLVGPGLLYLFAFESRYSDGFKQFLSMVINDIMPVINSGNNWIMLSVMVASIIRLSQYPPVFEMDFISTLLWFQWLMALARTVTTRVLTGRLDEKHRGRGAWSILFTFLALIFTFIASISAGYPAGPAQSEALVAISRFCAFENDLPIRLYVDTAEEEKSQLPWWQILLLKLAAPFIQAGLTAVVVIAGSILLVVGGAFLGLWAEITGFLWAKLPNGLKKQLTNLGLLALSALIVLLCLLPGALWLTLCIWLLTIMQGARNDLQMALGKQYQDSYWGFGQVTIVVMLLPSVFQVLGKIISRFCALPFSWSAS